MKSALSAIGSSLTPALLAILVALNGCQVSRQGVSGVPAIGSIQIGAARDCPDPGPDPSPAPKPPDPQPIPCPCPDPGPSPGPAPEPIPVPVPPTPDPTPPPPVPVVTGPIFATLIYDATSSDPALLAIKNDEPNLQTELAKIDAAWHAWTRDSSMYTTRLLPRLSQSQVVAIAGKPNILIQSQTGDVIRIMDMPATSAEIIAAITAFREGK